MIAIFSVSFLHEVTAVGAVNETQVNGIAKRLGVKLFGIAVELTIPAYQI